MKHDDGGPAADKTLLDYYAGRAMQGWIAAIAGKPFMDEYEDDEKAFRQHQAAVARSSYDYAAAMIAEKRRREASDE